MSGGDLPQGFTEATVRLIPKIGNSSNLADWRPISLLNNDYKIFTTLLRNRISPIADKLISKEQIGFMNGRSIDTNIWVVNKEYMEYQVNGTPRAMVFYDLEKAYNYVNHEALKTILHKRGFCTGFISLIKKLHDYATARVLTAHGPTDAIQRHSGVYQGCPLAPLLFNFVADCLANHFRNENKVRNQLLLQYADDTAFILRSPEGATLANKCMQEYTRAVGGKINYDKTDGILFGFQDGLMFPGNIVWKSPSHPLKYLGIIFGPQSDSKWTSLVEDIKSKISVWSNFHLSDVGKVRLWNQVMLSTLIYNMKGTLLNPKRLKELEDICRNFVYTNNQKYKVGSKPTHLSYFQNITPYCSISPTESCG